MKKAYTQAEVDAIRKEYEGNPYWRVTKIDTTDRAVHTEQTGISIQQFQSQTQSSEYCLICTFISYLTIAVAIAALLGVI